MAGAMVHPLGSGGDGTVRIVADIAAIVSGHVIAEQAGMHRDPGADGTPRGLAESIKLIQGQTGRRGLDAETGETIRQALVSVIAIRSGEKIIDQNQAQPFTAKDSQDQGSLRV
jgi:hypothetical protein